MRIRMNKIARDALTSDGAGRQGGIPSPPVCHRQQFPQPLAEHCMRFRPSPS